MPIKQLSLFVENRPGSLNAVCQVLKKHNLSIRTLSLADTQQFGILRLLVREHEEARRVLEEAGFAVFCHRRVAPNDQGISLGQLAIAQRSEEYRVFGSAVKDNKN